jgi:hypothetical protein
MRTVTVILITARLVLIRQALITAEFKSHSVVTQRFMTHGLALRSVQPMAERALRTSISPQMFANRLNR